MACQEFFRSGVCARGRHWPFEVAGFYPCLGLDTEGRSQNLALSFGAEHAPHLLPDTGDASATDAKMSPEGADYPALRDQANGLGSRIRPSLGGKP